jgi:uncharacterized surface protein with fasciclin (FAS1) repeats
MKKLILLFAVLVTVNLHGINVLGQSVPTSTLSGITDESDYYKFASLVRSANLDATLASLKSYTVFAPHNAIFRNMSPGKLDSLTSDPVKLAMLLRAHIVKGRYTKADIIKLLGLGKGKAKLTNILGQPLMLTRSKDNQLLLTDIKGNQAFFLKFDIIDPHGIIHGIDNVLIAGK